MCCISTTEPVVVNRKTRCSRHFSHCMTVCTYTSKYTYIASNCSILFQIASAHPPVCWFHPMRNGWWRIYGCFPHILVRSADVWQIRVLSFWFLLCFCFLRRYCFLKSEFFLKHKCFTMGLMAKVMRNIMMLYVNILPQLTQCNWIEFSTDIWYANTTCVLCWRVLTFAPKHLGRQSIYYLSFPRGLIFHKLQQNPIHNVEKFIGTVEVKLCTTPTIYLLPHSTSANKPTINQKPLGNRYMWIVNIGGQPESIHKGILPV